MFNVYNICILDEINIEIVYDLYQRVEFVMGSIRVEV